MKNAIICAGINCLDLQLLGCTKSGQEEAIEQYEKAVYCAGGSAAMTATTLAQILDKRKYEVYILTKLGLDRNGQVMMDFFQQSGASTDLVLSSPTVSTAMSVLPVFKSGGRGCYFNLASNNTFTSSELLAQLDKLPVSTPVEAFLLGYPHLLPLIQGEALRVTLKAVKEKFGDGTLIGVDLNGVSKANHNDKILGPAMGYIDVLHLNEEEAEIFSGCPKHELMKDDTKLASVCTKLHEKGCAIVLLSLGPKGAFISLTPDNTRLQNVNVHWTGPQTTKCPAFRVESGEINTNGAGDALFSSFCWAVSRSLSLRQTGMLAALVARQRCDVATRDKPALSATQLNDMVYEGDLPPTASPS